MKGGRQPRPSRRWLTPEILEANIRTHTITNVWIESKKNDKSGKVKEKSVERIVPQKSENKFEEKKVPYSIDLESSRDTAETDKEVAEAVAREVTDLVINKIEREALKKDEDNIRKQK